MEVDPPKDDAAASADGQQPPAPSGEAGNEKEAKNEDAEMKDADSSKTAQSTEEQPKKEMRTEKRKKVISKTIDLPVTSIVVGCMSRDKMDAALEQEKVLLNQDQYEGQRLVAKNAVEEYIYNIREKMSEELETFVVEADKETYGRKLTETEDWLYEDGEDCETNVYDEKLKELKLVGEAAKKRKSEYEGRKMAVDTLGHCLQMAAKMVDLYKTGDERYNHLTDAEVEKVAKLIDEKSQWLNNSMATLEKTPKTVNPSILNCQFVSEKDAFEVICRPILSKPKPKVEPPKDDKKAENEKDGGKKSKDDSSQNQQQPMEDAAVNGNGDENQQQPPMDLD